MRLEWWLGRENCRSGRGADAARAGATGLRGRETAGKLRGKLLEAGILDPTKGVRSALQNGASVASPLLTNAALIAEKPGGKKGGGMPR